MDYGLLEKSRKNRSSAVDNGLGVDLGSWNPFIKAKPKKCQINNVMHGVYLPRHNKRCFGVI